MFPTLVSLSGTTTYQFHSVCDDGFVWAHVSSLPRIRDSLPKGLETGNRCVLHHLIDVGHFEAVRQVPFN